MVLLPRREYRKNGKPQIQAQVRAASAIESKNSREFLGPIHHQWTLGQGAS